ncbi:hypothetical protein ACLKA6_018062 [Drosophila palustris]
MSEPLSSSGLRLVYNSLLLLSSGLAARKISFQKHPYAFSACVVGGAVAVLGLIRVIFGDDRDPQQFQILRDVSHSVMEMVPLPLVNMELYIVSHGVGPLALGHGIFVLPLLLDLRCSIVKDRKNCDFSETLRDLLVLGNIVSLGYLSVREGSFLYMRMAITMGVVKYIPIFLDSIQDSAGEDLIVCFDGNSNSPNSPAPLIGCQLLGPPSPPPSTCLAFLVCHAKFGRQIPATILESFVFRNCF